MLGSLARTSRDSGVPLGGKGSFLPFITYFIIKMVNQAKKLICRYDFYYFL